MNRENLENIPISDNNPLRSKDNPEDLTLRDNSRIAVIGGGPAGSFFSYFLLAMAERVDLSLQVDIYEPRDFSRMGPPGCNMCGGIISESLVQILATEGIILPPTVIQRGIDSYIFHTDVGSVQIDTPVHEKRIGAVFRGAGPTGNVEGDWESFDGFLLKLAQDKGARVVQDRVERVRLNEGLPKLRSRKGFSGIYDLVVVASGVNSSIIKLFEDDNLGYQPPATTRTFICEYNLGEKALDGFLGHSMHTFLLNIPRLEFAALIPKGKYATMCVLGRDIDKSLIQSILNTPVMKARFPADWRYEEESCRCFPRINISGATKPFTDRILFIGDSGVSRLYKDGIGAAYRTSKAAARTAIFEGISERDFLRHYWPACRAIEMDNRIGKFIFSLARVFQKRTFIKKVILRMVRLEKKNGNIPQRMSMIVWDLFTGSAPYREVFLRFWHPLFLFGFFWNLIRVTLPLGKQDEMEDS